MLSKSERLSKADFEKVFKHSKSCFSRLFVCRWAQNNLNRNRFAVVVSSNICPLAVDRNRKRRQSYEVIRFHKKIFHVSLDIILFGKKNLAGATFEQIEKDIDFLLERVTHESKVLGTEFIVKSQR